MTINIKMNRGDTVFFLLDNKICNGIIGDIKIDIGVEENVIITYAVRFNAIRRNQSKKTSVLPNSINLRERESFPSVEELLKSLKDEWTQLTDEQRQDKNHHGNQDKKD